MSQVQGSVGISSYHYVPPTLASSDRVSPKQPMPQGFTGQPIGAAGPTFPSLFTASQPTIPSPPPVLSPDSYVDQNSPNRSPHSTKALPSRFPPPGYLPPSPRNVLYHQPVAPSNLKSEQYSQFVPPAPAMASRQPVQPFIVPVSSYAYPQLPPHQQNVLAPLMQAPQQHQLPMQPQMLQQQQVPAQQQVPGQQQIPGQMPTMGYTNLPLYRPMTPTEAPHPLGAVPNSYNNMPTGHYLPGHVAPLPAQSYTLSKRVLKDGTDAGYYVKRHSCQYCGKSFVRPSALQTHTYSHTGEKPFVCDHPTCGRKFSVVSNLRRHQKVHMSSAERAKAS